MQQTTEPREDVPAPSVGSRLRRLDPWPYVVGVVALVTYLLRGFDEMVSRDIGIYAYGARQVLAGEPPYVGIVNRGGPLAHLLPVPGILAARLTGRDELLGMRAWYMVLAVACVVVAYLVARDLFASRTAGLVAAAALLSFEGFVALAVAGPREKTPMVLFILAAVWALSRRRWLLTGVCLSLATLTLQIAFFPLLAAAVVAVLMGGRGRRARDLLRFVVGGAIPVVAVLAYFAAYGAVHDLADGFLLLNLRYSSGTAFTSNPGTKWASIRTGFGASIWLVLAGLVLVLVVTALRIGDRERRRDELTTTMVALSVATVGSVLWTEVDFDSWVDLFTVLPLAALGLAAGYAELAHRVPRGAARVVAVAAVVLPTLLAVHYSLATRGGQLPLQRAVAREVVSHLPDGPVWSIESPEYLFLADRTNPTRYQVFSSGLQDYVDDTWPGGTRAFVAWNLARHPDLIVVNQHRLADQPWRRWIGPGYARVATAPGATWFVRRSLGHHVLEAIRKGDARVHQRLG